MAEAKKFKITQSVVLVSVIVALAIVATIVNPRFLRVNNLLNILQQVAVLGIIASGVGMLLVSGQVDISVGAQVSLMGVIMAMIIQEMLGLPEGNVAPWREVWAIPIAVVVTLLLGLLMGFINGLTVVKSKAHSLILTIGFMTVYEGVAILISGGASFMLFGRFETIGQGQLFGIIPYTVLVFLAIIVITHLVLTYMRYGRFLYAIGGNSKAAYVSGIDTAGNQITAYVVVGLLNAVATILLISRVGSALATTGSGYALDALAAVIVGGVSILGGRGKALGMFLGVLLIGLIGNALVIMNVNPHVRGVVIGLVIIAAVTVGEATEE